MRALYDMGHGDPMAANSKIAQIDIDANWVHVQRTKLDSNKISLRLYARTQARVYRIIKAQINWLKSRTIPSPIECLQSDMGGQMALYRIKGMEGFLLDYDALNRPRYPWMPVPLCPTTGRMLSSVGYTYADPEAAIQAIREGTYK